MREYCLVSKIGTVLNMCMTAKPEGPYLSDEQKERGSTWIPVEKVSSNALRTYQYWNERP